MDATLETARRRRETIKEILMRGDPKVTSRAQLANMLREGGFEINNLEMIGRDLERVGASKVAPPGRGQHYYILAGRSLTRSLDVAVSEAEARRRMQNNALGVSVLEGCVPVFVETVAGAGMMTGQPFGAWKPWGVRAVLSGHEGVLLYVEAAEVARVHELLFGMMTGKL